MAGYPLLPVPFLPAPDDKRVPGPPVPFLDGMAGPPPAPLGTGAPPGDMVFTEPDVYEQSVPPFINPATGLQTPQMPPGPGPQKPAVAGQDVPVIPRTPEEEQAVLAAQKKPTSPAAPGMPPSQIDPAAGLAKNAAPAPGARPSTGVPFLDAAGDAFQKKRGGIMAESQAESDKVKYLSEQNYQAAKLTEKRLAEDEAFRKQAYQDAKAQGDQLKLEAKAIAEEKIDPDKTWTDASFLGKVAQAVGVALGGLLLPFGVKNPALAILQEMNDKEFEAQKIALQNKKDAWSMQNTLLGQEIALGRDEYDARVKMTLATYDVARQTIIDYAQKFDSPAIQARAQQALAGLDMEQAQLEQGYLDRKAAEAEDKRRWNAQYSLQKRGVDLQEMNMMLENQRYYAGLDARRQEEQQKIDDAERQRRADLEKEHRTQTLYDPVTREPIAYLPGLDASAPADREAVRGYRKKVAAYAKYKRAIKNYKEAMADPDAVPGGEHEAKLMKAWADVVTIWKSDDFAKLGVLSGDDMVLAEKALGSPQAFWSFKEDAMGGIIDTVDRNADDSIDKDLGAEGVQFFDPSENSFSGIYNRGESAPPAKKPGAMVDDKRTSDQIQRGEVGVGDVGGAIVGGSLETAGGILGVKAPKVKQRPQVSDVQKQQFLGEYEHPPNREIQEGRWNFRNRMVRGALARGLPQPDEETIKKAWIEYRAGGGDPLVTPGEDWTGDDDR